MGLFLGQRTGIQAIHSFWLFLFVTLWTHGNEDERVSRLRFLLQLGLCCHPFLWGDGGVSDGRGLVIRIFRSGLLLFPRLLLLFYR